MSAQHKARLLYLETKVNLSKAEKSELEQLNEFLGNKPKMVVKEPVKEVEKELKKENKE